MNTCPNCQNGKTTSIYCPGGRIIKQDCDYCHGTGQITDEQLRAIQAGREARADRIRRGLSQNEEAARLGWDRVQYSKFENGRPFQPPKETQP